MKKKKKEGAATFSIVITPEMEEALATLSTRSSFTRKHFLKLAAREGIKCLAAAFQSPHMTPSAAEATSLGLFRFNGIIAGKPKKGKPAALSATSSDISQLTEFTKLVMGEVDQYQLARIAERWEFICEQKGWMRFAEDKAVERELRKAGKAT